MWRLSDIRVGQVGICIALLLFQLGVVEVLALSGEAAISTDHDAYYLGESVNILLPPGDYQMLISSSKGTYQFAGAPGENVLFVPPREGKYDIVLQPHDAERSTLYRRFEVVSRVTPLVEKRDLSGRLLPTNSTSFVRGGREWLRLEGGHPFVQRLEVRLPSPGGVSGASGGSREELTLDVVSNPVTPPAGLRWKRAFYLAKTMPSSEVLLDIKAAGTSLHRCRSDTKGVCLGLWEKVMDMQPGFTYPLQATTTPYVYAEAGVSTVNTEHPMYHPGETARIWIAVLDASGFPVSDANVVLIITSPGGGVLVHSTSTGDIREIYSGVYEATFLTQVEGTHDLYVTASTEEGTSIIESSFEVARQFDFDIIRNAPMIINPWAPPFQASVIVRSLVGAAPFTVVERIPDPLQVFDAGGALVARNDSGWTLTWSDVSSADELSYMILAPKVSPVIYALGPVQIRYGGPMQNQEFYEARPWLIAADPPPDVFGIAGWIFDSDNLTQAPLGTPYTINNTNSSFFLMNVTRIPIPGQSGRYSELVEAFLNETFRIRSWNATHWGTAQIDLAGDVDNVNISLSQRRPGEPNVTVILPVDGTLFGRDDPVLIQANVTVDPDQNASAIACNATVSFTTASVIALDPGENATQFLGNISPGQRLLANWSAFADNAGSTDIVVTVVCFAGSSGFDTFDNDSALNIQVNDTPPPTPHGVAGWILDCDNTTQVPLGTPYTINNTQDTYYLENETRIPFPGFSGRYSETIDGTDGDNITVLSWNDTHWGWINVSLLGDMDDVNVSLCTERTSELNVTFIHPLNNSNYDPLDHFENVTVIVTNIGPQNGSNCSVTLLISDIGIVNLSTGESYTHDLGNITSGGTVQTIWNVTVLQNGTLDFTANASCETDGKNFEDANWAQVVNVTLNSLPNLQVNESDITFSDDSPLENVTINITALIHNLGNEQASNVTVRFFVDNLTNQINGDIILDIGPFSNATAVVNWTTVTGTHEIFVLVDPDNQIEEYNESNNNASRNITILSWQIYYGPLDGTIVLDDAVNQSTLRWNASLRGNIYATETGSDIDFTSLVPIGRNTTYGIAFEDYAQVDGALNMTPYNDSVNRTFTTGNSPRFLQSFFVYGTNISNVSAVNSTNTSAFQTGILWDSSDDTSGDFTFDGSDREDIVFVTEITPNQVGQYGVYDYEMRLPANLRHYKYDSGTISFYVELR